MWRCESDGDMWRCEGVLGTCGGMRECWGHVGCEGVLGTCGGKGVMGTCGGKGVMGHVEV